MTAVTLVEADGSLRRHQLHDAPALRRPRVPLTSRVTYAAAHVVPRVAGENVPGALADIDWDSTLAFRHHIWSWGLGVADAMDTAQRNMGLDPAATRELVARSAAEAQSVGGRLVVGVNTDHVSEPVLSLDAVIAAYCEQLHYAEDHGAGVVLMASRHLARAASGPADYQRVYREVLARAGAPVILHWLGAAFDSQLQGYFGSADTTVASRTVLDIITENGGAVSGIKMSLLDADAEIALRRQLPNGCRLYTGDDFHYVDLVAGDGTRYSDALLGAFAAFAPNASSAIQALDAGDPQRYRSLLEPTEPLAQHVFAAPTYNYKAGVAFLSWLNGHQPAYAMVGGLHAARSLPHLSHLIRLADRAGALEHPDLAAQRWTDMVTLHGVVPDAVTR
jgi:uncharacterized protein DUF993